MTSSRLDVLMVAGTRPEVIKLAPVVRELKARSDQFDVRLCVTGQHREMLAQTLGVFALDPDVDLQVMQSSQTLADTTARVLTGVSRVLSERRPDWVVVQGDTTTAMAAALAAFYVKVPVAHVEAGLRTGDRFAPFPEEINRRIADVVADVHFAPTVEAANHLRREGTPESSIVVTGNTSVDALLYAVTVDRPTSVDRLLSDCRGRRIVTITAHRRENFGEPLERICRAIARLARRFPEDRFVYPLHLNPHVQTTARQLLRGIDNVVLTDPLDYLSFAKLLEASSLLLTDSGGIQEEAPSLRKPVLVLRESTERPEAVAAGTARLVGSDEDAIVAAATELLTDPSAYARMVASANPFGDGHASERIVRELRQRARHTTRLLAETEAR